jgi:hypothetical protein
VALKRCREKTILCEDKQNSGRRLLAVRKLSYLHIALLLVFAATAINTPAQNVPGQTSAASAQLTATNSVARPTGVVTTAAATQSVLNSLSSLPEADTMIYINPQRILNEVVPKLLPAKDVENMRKGFEEAKKNAGIDPDRVEYLVIAVRFRKPTAELSFQPPEFLVVTGGDFSAESLITLAHSAAQGKLRDEKYGNKTIGLMTIDPIVKQAEKNPFLKAFSEIGVVALNGNTIATGTPGYLRAAIDAEGGKERINPATLSSLVRDTNALISMAGSPWHSFAKSFGMLGTETNARAARCESNMGDFYAALTMDATNFMIRGAMNADNPDTAKIMTNLFFGFLNQAASSIPDASVQSLLKNLAMTAAGDEVLLRADFPQQMVMELIKQKTQPKGMTDSGVVTPPPANPPSKPAVKRRRGRRRH